MADDLTAPLGSKPVRRKHTQALRTALFGAAIGLVGITILVFGAWIVLVDDPFGGEPEALVEVKIADAPNPDQINITRGPRSSQTELQVPASNLPEDPSGDIIISATGVNNQAALNSASLTNENLTEKSQFGLIPRVGADGVRPMDYYARPAANGAYGLSRVMIIVGGLGLSQTSTQAALAKLPPEITLAFAPYGNSLDRWVSAARQNGHELLLQVPQEPFNYPSNDPGPHTLLTDLSLEENRARLHWLMARISSYTGVINYMGGQFTSRSDVMTDFLEEIASRGLLFVYDGVATLGEIESLAGATATPFARADIVLDANPNADSIDNALLQLESLARQKGLAVATASALPISIERISRWAESAESRGLEIVPAAAAVRAFKELNQ